MSDLYHSNILTQMDAHVLQVKEHLVNTVSTEMQNQSTLQQQNREAVHRLLLEAYERKYADLKPEFATGSSILPWLT